MPIPHRSDNRCRRLRLPVALPLLLISAAAACTSEVSGSAVPDPASTRSPAFTSVPTRAAPTELSAAPEAAPEAPSTGGDVLLDAGLPDDCLLPEDVVATLTGVPAVYSENVTVGEQPAENLPTSCFYTAEGDFVPRARIQVYTSDPLTPAEVLDAQGGTTLAGVVDVATVTTQDGDVLVWVGRGERTAVLRVFSGNGPDGPPAPEPTTLAPVATALSEALAAA